MPNFVKKFRGSTRTEMALSSRWKILNKELGNWREALAKVMDNYRSGENRTNEMIQAQMWFGATRGGKKSGEILQTLPDYSDGSAVVLNETSLRDSMTSDSPIDSPESRLTIEKELRPIGRKAAKAKKAGNCKAKRHKIEMEQKRQDNELALQGEYTRERKYLRKKDMDKTDRETMTMDTSHMSPETKQFWKLERRDVMRRRLFGMMGLATRIG
ncbi:hypothetical protein Prudu_014019 [Prunus dulcis]|uniref:No apical meristem-associated C-terminal domain-containing protein n=1 Tax=Prunus dulcis TaxID=3755 RepID=A0A4Y1RG16_PRUDU|nr:hypothetical protein Prudu_014019 [Prunus dulcis]